MIGQVHAFYGISISLEAAKELDERLMYIGHSDRRYVISGTLG